MKPIRSLQRLPGAALLALLLGLRLLAGTGYMPGFEHGRIMLIVCPDGQWADASVSMPHLGRHHAPAHERHDQCPYAAAGLTPLAAVSAPALAAPFIVLLLVGAFALPSLAARTRVERPTQTGPPIPAIVHSFV